MLWLPAMGALSDRIGRRGLLVFFAGFALLSAYPAMSWLVRDPSFAKLLGVELWLSFLYAGYNGAMVVYLTEIVPVTVRTAGFSLAYSLATTVGWFDTGDRDLFDPSDRESGHARCVAVARRGLVAWRRVLVEKSIVHVRLFYFMTRERPALWVTLLNEA